MSDPAPTVGPATGRRRFPRRWLYGGSFLCFLLLLGLALGPIPNGLKQAQVNARMQQGRQIGQMMFSYATDNIQNNNAYPDGNSSTEVFQKLLDGGYCTDPTIFYLPLPGKIKPVPGQKLKPENVGWDVTSGVDSGDSNWVPLLFVTGYKITYASGAPAVPLVKSPNPDSHGVAVFYKGNDAVYRSPGMVTNPDGSISNFIPADFNPKGKTYRQLTPDGPLP